MKHARPYRLYFRKDTGFFYYRLPDEGRWRSTGQTKETAAHRFVIEQVLPANKSEQTEPAPTLRDYALPAFEQYAAAKRAARKPLSDGYVKACQQYIDRYLIVDEIAEKRLDQLTLEDFEGFQTRLLEEVLPDRRTTAVRVLEVARLVLRRAEKAGRIAASPDRSAVKPEQGSRTRDIYSAEEMNTLFPADAWEKDDFSPWQDELDYTAFVVAASTGMRKSEILALDWPAVHLEEAEEHVEIRGSLRASGEIGPTKGRRPRSTPIFDFVLWPDRRAVRALKELRKRRTADPGAIVDMAGRPVGPVFSRGDRLGGTWWQKRLRAALRKATIRRNRGAGVMPLDAHALRHTLASHLKAAGMPDDLIRRFCGWSSLNVQSRYTHIEPEMFGRIMKLVRKTSQ